MIQFFFFEQWHALRLYCAQKSIRVVGDIAIFVTTTARTSGPIENCFA